MIAVEPVFSLPPVITSHIPQILWTAVKSRWDPNTLTLDLQAFHEDRGMLVDFFIKFILSISYKEFNA